MFEVYSEFLFPRQVIISKDLQYSSYKEELIKYCLNKKNEDPTGQKFTNINSWQSDEILYDQLLCNVFRERIKTNVSSSIKKELKLFDNVGVNIIRMWIQISQKNSFNITHNHPFCHYSGVFYVKTSNDLSCGSLCFHPYSNANEYQSLIFSEEEFLDKNNMNCSKTYIPIEGTTILFPSGLRHSVQLNNTNSDRISIAFDILFEKN